MYSGTVTVYPDVQEKKQIKKRYLTAALVMLIDVAVFQGLSRLVLLAAGLLKGASGGYADIIAAGSSAVVSNDILSVIYSCGFPILAEISAIAFGARALGIDLKSKFSFTGVSGKDIAGGTAASFFGQTAAAFLISMLSLLFVDKAQDIVQSAITAKTSLAANIIMYTYVCLLGPVIEEILFRGIILESMRQYNERFAIVFSSLIFGLMHCNIPQAVNGFIVGLVLGALYVRSRSLIPSSAVHIIMNTVTSLLSVMLYSDSGMLKKIMGGSISGLNGFASAGIVINLIVRLVSLPAGITVLVISGMKGFGLRKANEAGKKRSAPLVWTSPLWIAVIIVYGIICFINF